MITAPHWTATVSAIAIAVVAIIGAYIAWNMWRTNRDILRERLFDRRFDVFQTTQKLISGIVVEDGASWDAANRFTELAHRARFMFSAEDAQYFDLLRTRAMELATATSVIDKNLPSKFRAARKEQEELCMWFDDQVEELFSRMNKYLLFDK